MPKLMTQEEAMNPMASVDEICDRIVALSQTHATIQEISIRPGEMKVSYWVADDVIEAEPPNLFAADTLEGVLSTVDMIEVLPERERRLSYRSLALVDSLYDAVRMRGLHAVAWIIADRAKFLKFFGMEEMPSLFFDMPIHVQQTVNSDKIILLGATSRLYRPKSAAIAICGTMIIDPVPDITLVKPRKEEA